MENAIFEIHYHMMEIPSMMTFANIKGGSHPSGKEVSFVRCIGHDAAYLQDIRTMDRLLTKRAANGQGGYYRISRLPELAGQEDIAFYTEAYRQWSSVPKSRLLLKNVKPGMLPEAVVTSAMEKVCQTFSIVTPNTNETILKNFIIKLFFWLDALLPELFDEWKVQGSYKLVCSGRIKKQEYLFFYFLTRLGIDVMILSPEKELELDAGLLVLSSGLKLAYQSKLDIPEYQKEIPQEQAAQNRAAVYPENIRPESQSNQTKEQPVRVVIPPRRSGQRPLTAERSTGRERTEKKFEELALLASSVVMITIHDRTGKVIGSGSGIMIAAKGYILTNNHVASGGSYYCVRIEDDDRVYQTSEVIKYHSILDLALIRIDRSLTPIPIYKGKEKLVRGQKVVAIGSPLGFFNSVSDGIISGFRYIDDVNMIQFTAPISHGSSGGAVLNMYGEIIGISTAGIDSGQNINLAVDCHDITNFVRGFL